MHKIFLISFLFFTTLPALAANADNRVWLAPDFFVSATLLSETASLEASSSTATGSDCRAHIAEVICKVNGAKNKHSNRVCLPDSKQYAAPFEQIYDQLTPTMQRMFCSLKRLFVEVELTSTGYSGIRDGFGAVMGVRESLLQRPLEYAQWASWKEQLSFGHNSNQYQPDPLLPRYESTPSVPLNLFLYQFVVHEFGHLFDFANELNSYSDCTPGNWNSDKGCTLAPNSWGAISWLKTNQVKPDADYPGRSSLCFYHCGGQFADASRADELYQAQYLSPFINSYASSNHMDDLADSLAIYAMNRLLRVQISVATRSGKSWSLTDKLDSPQFEAKREYLENFLSRSDLLYP